MLIHCYCYFSCYSSLFFLFLTYRITGPGVLSRTQSPPLSFLRNSTEKSTFCTFHPSIHQSIHPFPFPISFLSSRNRTEETFHPHNPFYKVPSAFFSFVSRRNVSRTPFQARVLRLLPLRLQLHLTSHLRRPCTGNVVRDPAADAAAAVAVADWSIPSLLLWSRRFAISPSATRSDISSGCSFGGCMRWQGCPGKALSVHRHRQGCSRIRVPVWSRVMIRCRRRPSVAWSVTGGMLHSIGPGQPRGSAAKP